MAKSCIRWLKWIFFACVPIFGWIGFVYHIAFAFVMTVVSHNVSEFFVVVAPVLDVLFYILEIWVYTCKSRVIPMVQYTRLRDFRN